MLIYLITVIPADWLRNHNLVTKCIYIHVRNTDPEFVYREHFASGYYEGERGMILEPRDKWRVMVAIKQQWLNIPTRHLFYEMPTSKGQLVVVISDDHAGEIYVMCEPNERCSPWYDGVKATDWHWYVSWSREDWLDVMPSRRCLSYSCHTLSQTLYPEHMLRACFDISSLVTPHVDKDTLYPTSCRTHVL
jgi:hypothetical protein